MSENRPQVYISPTRVKTFLECKFKFQQKYKLKTKPSNITPPHVFGPGNTVHKLAQHFTSDKLNSSEEARKIEISKTIKEYGLDEKMFFNSISDQYDEVIKYLTPFLNDSLNEKARLGREKKININWFGDFWFYGYIDFRAIYDDRAIVTDYKSSKREDNHDIQLAIYAYATSKELGKSLEEIETNILYTKLKKTVVRKMGFEEVKENLRIIADVLKQERDSKDWKKQPNQYCENCEYFTLCKPHD
jgi:CRISPR/Cas system-associated exonuclease Cas4 (RecB family)